MSNLSYTRTSIIGLMAAVVPNIVYYVYLRFYAPDKTKFAYGFIAQGKDFNRHLTTEEKYTLSAFPNIKKDLVTFLGVAAVKPSDENCKHYKCFFPHTIIMYDKITGIYKSTVSSVSSDLDMAQLVWEKCHSDAYKCTYQTHIGTQYQGHFGATYNCIGWALGITKWLDPGEITAYIKLGKSKKEAIDQFIQDKAAIFDNIHASNIDKIVDKLHATSIAPHNSIANNTVAFFFDNNNQCQHGARYLETLDNNPLNKFTSKLGGYITIAHDEYDLLGNSSPYGNSLYYAKT